MRGRPTQWQCDEIDDLEALAEMVARQAGE